MPDVKLLCHRHRIHSAIQQRPTVSSNAKKEEMMKIGNADNITTMNRGHRMCPAYFHWENWSLERVRASFTQSDISSVCQFRIPLTQTSALIGERAVSIAGANVSIFDGGNSSSVAQHQLMLAHKPNWNRSLIELLARMRLFPLSSNHSNAITFSRIAFVRHRETHVWRPDARKFRLKIH